MVRSRRDSLYNKLKVNIINFNGRNTNISLKLSILVLINSFVSLLFYYSARFLTKRLKKNYFSGDTECLNELNLVWKKLF